MLLLKKCLHYSKFQIFKFNLKKSKCKRHITTKSIENFSSNLNINEALINKFINLNDLLQIENNIKLRRHTIEHLNKIKSLINQKALQLTGLNANEKEQYFIDLLFAFRKLPNQTHPDILEYGDKPKLLHSYGEKWNLTGASKPLKSFPDICKYLNILRADQLGNLTGTKSYYLMNSLAKLEQALIQYTVDYLLKENFQLITVPDILPAEIIENCGMNTSGDRNQVYKIAPLHPELTSSLCLSGTSEMALAGYYLNKKLASKDLPIKLMAVSRCFRAETSGLAEERGIYRVHQFTKIEMFSVCLPNQSNDMLEYIKNIEIDLFKNFNINFILLDMPPCELGAPAYRKYDIEAWMPGRNMYGEISSCSNCTDYQSKRLNICFNNNNNSNQSDNYAHTINGTACAVPRMLITIFENYQKSDGSIEIPEVLQPYMNGEKIIIKQKLLPELRLTKNLQDI